MNAVLIANVKPKATDIANCLCARDYKGPGNLSATTVVKYETDDFKNS